MTSFMNGPYAVITSVQIDFDDIEYVKVRFRKSYTYDCYVVNHGTIGNKKRIYFWCVFATVAPIPQCAWI